MVKLIILFKKPPTNEIESFENVFSQSYVPVINKVPNLLRATVTRTIGAPRGEAAYYLIHELFFNDFATLTQSLNTPQGREAGERLMGFARDLITLMYAETWEEPIQHGA